MVLRIVTMAFALCACSSKPESPPSSPAATRSPLEEITTTSAPPPAPTVVSSRVDSLDGGDPSSVGCTLLPQPSLPGHTTVEPADMACTHGDYAFDCPTSFDASRFHCRRSTSKAWTTLTPWCCPGRL